MEEKGEKLRKIDTIFGLFGTDFEKFDLSIG